MSVEKGASAAVVPKEKSIFKTRGGHKSFATKIMKETQDLVKVVDGDKNAIKEDLTANLEVLEDKLKVISMLDEEIMDIIPDAGIEEEISTSSAFRKEIIKSQISIKNWLSSNQDDAIGSHSTRLDEAPSFYSHNQVRLPKLELPKFNGDPLSYQNFWDSFNSAIHQNNSLDDAAKFNYLKGQLEGKARLAIQGLTLTSENYQSAIGILKQRFGDPQVIIKAHMDSLIAISPVTSNKLSDLRDLCDMVEIHARNLQLFDVHSEHYGPVLVSLILSKIPRDISIEISRQMPDGGWKIDNFMSTLKKEVLSRERCLSPADVSDEPINSSALYSQQKPGVKQNGSRSFTITCSYCRRSHPSNRCDVVTDTESRKSVLRRKNKCFICLRNNHSSKDCYSKRMCSICNGKHHVSICFKREQPFNRSDHSNKKDSNKQGDDVVKEVKDASTSVSMLISKGVVNHSTPPCTENSAVTDETNKSISCSNSFLISDNHTSVLLKTAKAKLINEALNKGMECRLLFDEGSQRSFISNLTKEKLKLPTLRTEFLNVKTFACKEDNVQRLDVVKFNVVNKFDSSKRISVEAYVVPFVCAPISNQRIDVAKIKHEFRSLQFADINDSNNSDLKIDLLIGSDYYNDFCTRKSIRCLDDTGLTAWETTLGWVLNGNVRVKNIPNVSTNSVVSHVMLASSVPMGGDNDLFNFWNIQDSGVCDINHEFDITKFSDKIVYNEKEKRYFVPLPWCPGAGCLRDNYRQSKVRLVALMNRLRDDPEKLEEYRSIIKKQESEGIIERCYSTPPPGQVHYLPHHYVQKESTTTKLRIVFDASSNKPSLNDMLEKGPCPSYLIS